MYITAPLPTRLDGGTLRKELTRAGVRVTNLSVTDDQLHLEVPDGTNEAVARDVVATHQGQDAEDRAHYKEQGRALQVPQRTTALEEVVDALILDSLTMTEALDTLILDALEA